MQKITFSFSFKKETSSVSSSFVALLSGKPCLISYVLLLNHFDVSVPWLAPRPDSLISFWWSALLNVATVSSLLAFKSLLVIKACLVYTDPPAGLWFFRNYFHSLWEWHTQVNTTQNEPSVGLSLPCLFPCFPHFLPPSLHLPSFHLSFPLSSPPFPSLPLFFSLSFIVITIDIDVFNRSANINLIFAISRQHNHSKSCWFFSPSSIHSSFLPLS